MECSLNWKRLCWHSEEVLKRVEVSCDGHIYSGDTNILKILEVYLTNNFRKLVVTLLQQGTRVSIVLLSLPLSPAAGKVIVSDSFLARPVVC